MFCQGLLVVGLDPKAEDRGQVATLADVQPSTAAVLESLRRLLAEMETQTLTGMLQGHAGAGRAE